MQSFAVGWLVVQLAVADGAPQRAPLYLGLVGASRAIPGLTAGLFAGTYSDRVADRRRMLLAVQLGGGAIAAALAALAFADRLGVIPLMVATAMIPWPDIAL